MLLNDYPALIGLLHTGKEEVLSTEDQLYVIKAFHTYCRHAADRSSPGAFSQRGEDAALVPAGVTCKKRPLTAITTHIAQQGKAFISDNH
jgi:hypothetical protein